MPSLKLYTTKNVPSSLRQKSAILIPIMSCRKRKAKWFPMMFYENVFVIALLCEFFDYKKYFSFNLKLMFVEWVGFSLLHWFCFDDQFCTSLLLVCLPLYDVFLVAFSCISPFLQFEESAIFIMFLETIFASLSCFFYWVAKCISISFWSSLSDISSEYSPFLKFCF